MKKFIVNSLLFLFCLIVLALSLRGLPGNPTLAQLNSSVWTDSGPFELSPERGHFALLYSIAEFHSFQFPVDLARFVSPDVGFIHGNYVSLFAPSLSIVALPGYMIGKLFGMAQVGSFAVIALFAIINVFLIRAIAVRLGAHKMAATIAGLTFLFASPAFSYAVTMYQHHLSTFLILLGIYLLISFDNLFSLLIIWILCAFSITVDYPNLFMMLPIGIMALGKTILVHKDSYRISVSVPLLRILTLVGLILPMIFFLWFNKVSYGSPLQLSGTVERAIQIKANGKPVLEHEIVQQRLKANKQAQQNAPQKSALGFFQNRNMINGLYILFLSPDRGILYYTPIMFFGVIGLVLAVKKRQPYTALLVAIIGFDVLLYSMWDDPYGGWAFGARYLIPSYAILSIFIAQALSAWKKYNLFILAFFLVFTYSATVNTLGAITSSSNPPKVEAESLSNRTNTIQQYTYLRNLTIIEDNGAKSVIFQAFAQNYISAWTYFSVLTVGIVGITGTMLVMYRMQKKGEDTYAV